MSKAMKGRVVIKEVTESWRLVEVQHGINDEEHPGAANEIDLGQRVGLDGYSPLSTIQYNYCTGKREHFC